MKVTILKSIYVIILLYYAIGCTTTLEKEIETKTYLVEAYATMYNFYNEPFYEPIFDEFYNDTIHRFYWELKDDDVELLLKYFFKPFNGENFQIDEGNISYSYFGLIFHRSGKILQEGFFDDNWRFSGKMYHYYFDELQINKDIYKLDHKFYEVFYQIDSTGNLIDSTYKYFLIVLPDKDTFEGPSLSICFDVQLIIDRNKYDYQDFELFYNIFDTRHHQETKLIDKHKDKIFENIINMPSTGYYKHCYDFKVNHHLMMAFGLLVPQEVSGQELSIGKIHGPIINKNIDSIEL